MKHVDRRIIEGDDMSVKIVDSLRKHLELVACEFMSMLLAEGMRRWGNILSTFIRNQGSRFGIFVGCDLEFSSVYGLVLERYYVVDYEKNAILRLMHREWVAGVRKLLNIKPEVFAKFESFLVPAQEGWLSPEHLERNACNVLLNPTDHGRKSFCPSRSTEVPLPQVTRITS